MVSCPLLPSVRGGDHDHRIDEVDARDGDAVDQVDGVAGRQQAPGLAARRVEEAQRDRRRGAGHAVQFVVALVGDATAGRLHAGFDDPLAVEVEDPDDGERIAGRDQTPLDRERRHAGQHVAADGRDVDEVAADRDLRKQVLDVDAGSRRRCDDHHLAALIVAAAEAVDLAQVGRAHRGQQQAISSARVAGRSDARK